MENKYKSKKGISFLLVFGSYGGLHVTLGKSSFHVCIAFVAFTIFFYDVENALAMMLNEKDQETNKNAALNISVVKHRFFFDCWKSDGKIESKTIFAENIKDAELLFGAKYPTYAYDPPY